MQINPGSSAGILDDINFICGTDTTSYPTADKVRNINRHYYKAVIDIIKTEGRLQWDDSNLGSVPEYPVNLVDGQKNYTLPTNLLKLWALEVKDSAGNSHRIKEIDLSDPIMARTIADLENVSGVPKYYDVRGNYVYLYPAPSSSAMTLTSGGNMLFSREVDAFTTSDTTQEPGFAEPFHRLLSLGAAYDWLVINDTNAKADRVLQQYEQLRAELRQFYSSRTKDNDPAVARPMHNQLGYV